MKGWDGLDERPLAVGLGLCVVYGVTVLSMLFLQRHPRALGVLLPKRKIMFV
ncbi:inner membrane protein YbhQ domain protein [Enterobacter hormaechei subsp. xiangfangensis]|nr:inner membrane protein YbhQ domain protein [Enterobacter hormaechei subsp. xiangfangensis]